MRCCLGFGLLALAAAVGCSDASESAAAGGVDEGRGYEEQKAVMSAKAEARPKRDKAPEPPTDLPPPVIEEPVARDDSTVAPSGAVDTVFKDSNGLAMAGGGDTVNARGGGGQGAPAAKPSPTVASSVTKTPAAAVPLPSPAAPSQPTTGTFSDSGLVAGARKPVEANKVVAGLADQRAQGDMAQLVAKLETAKAGALESKQRLRLMKEAAVDKAPMPTNAPKMAERLNVLESEKIRAVNGKLDGFAGFDEDQDGEKDELRKRYATLEPDEPKKQEEKKRRKAPRKAKEERVSDRTGLLLADTEAEPEEEQEEEDEVEIAVDANQVSNPGARNAEVVRLPDRLDDRERLSTTRGPREGVLRPSSDAHGRPVYHWRTRGESKAGEGKSSNDAYRGGERRRRDFQMPEHWRRSRPDSFISDTCYFENTYLGGNAAYLARLERLDAELESIGAPHRLARTGHQGFDKPAKSGLGVTATLSDRSFDGPGRVFLQVGLQGSERFGWRRPPLEIVLVVDGAAVLGAPSLLRDTVRALMTRLDSQDRLGVVATGPAGSVELVGLKPLRELRTELLPRLDGLTVQSGRLADAVSTAGQVLAQASVNRTTLPGTQTVLVLAGSGSAYQVQPTAEVAHRLTLQGVVTSVIERGATAGGPFWAIAASGHGNYHRAPASAIDGAVESELESLSRVVARLVRLNIRLRNGAKAIRVLGAKVLDQQTVKEVKAREVATDRQLSKAMGIEADRGDDDDGIQTVIPYFYGGDAHVVVLELWVENPGAVADVTVRYKDMVSLGNATARTAASLRTVPRPLSAEQLAVLGNVAGLTLADSLDRVADALERGDRHTAQTLLSRISDSASRQTSSSDLDLIARFISALNGGASPASLVESMRMASRRKRGGTGV